MRFYIDGVLQSEWSGEASWAVVSYPIAAGTRTLRWSYEKDESVVSGADAAWIDAVVLPSATTLPGAPTLNAIGSGRGSAMVTFAAPGNNGGTAITGYIATCSAPGKTTRTKAGPGSPLTVNGLTGGVNYACSVAATNSVGTGPSSATLAVIPLAAINLTPILMLLLE